MPTVELEKIEAAAYRDSVKKDILEINSWVLDNVGNEITSAALGVKDASLRDRRIRPELEMLPLDHSERLRLIYRVARMLTDAFDDAAARAFLTSSNPELGDKAPVVILCEQKPAQAGPVVIGAVRNLIGG